MSKLSAEQISALEAVLSGDYFEKYVIKNLFFKKNTSLNVEEMMSGTNTQVERVIRRLAIILSGSDVPKVYLKKEHDIYNVSKYTLVVGLALMTFYFGIRGAQQLYKYWKLLKGDKTFRNKLAAFKKHPSLSSARKLFNAAKSRGQKRR